MRRPPRRPPAGATKRSRGTRAFVLLAAVTLLAVPPPAGAAGAPTTAGAAGSPPTTGAAGPPPVTGLSPSPGAVVPAGRVVLEARVRSSQHVAEARFVVGAPGAEQTLAADVGPTDPDEGTTVRATATLPAGGHAVRVEGRDVDDRPWHRAWSVTATDRSVRRYAGASRIDTAAEASAAAFPAVASAPAAVVARADDFADALAGVPLATAVDGPLLLTGRGGLSPATARELDRVVAPGGTVHLLGGEGALGVEVARGIEQLGLRTRRHGGANRYATAAVVARALPPSPGVVLASGVSFPDALAASAPAARAGWPVLLTAPGRLPGSTAVALADRGAADVIIVGGTAAVGADVERQAGQTGATVARVAGPDRYATASAVADAFFDEPVGVSLASGVDFPDALSGTRHAVLLDQPLLLTRPSALPAATADAIRARRPHRLDVYGGPAAVAESTADQALLAAVDGPDAPRMTASAPTAGETVAALETVSVRMDRPVDPARSSVFVEVGGAEVAGTLAASPAADTLTFRPDGRTLAAYDTPWPGRVVVRAVAADGTAGHATVPFTYLEPDPFYAEAGGVALHLPSRRVDLIGFHEATHPGAQQQSPRATATPMTVLPGRNRGTGSRTAADVVAAPDQPVLAPVTGRVVRAGAYVLYCRYGDDFAVIEPDERPGWEVKVLHFHGVRVQPGDRVVASETVIGDRPRVLPFESQVDRYSTTRWPHLHVEVVDPSVPPRPGGGC